MQEKNNDKFICNFCNKSFSTKSNLTNHQKRTKKCLELQNNNTRENLFHCDDCKKQYSPKQIFDKHACKKEWLSKLLEEKDKEIAYLKNELSKANEKIAQLAEIGMKKSSIKTTYKVNQNIIDIIIPFDITSQMIKEIFEENFTYENLLNGKEGIVNFILEFILTENGKYKMICTDNSRRIFTYMDKNNKIHRDKDANFFMNMLIPILTKKSNEIMKEKLTPESIIDDTKYLLLKTKYMTIQELENNKNILIKPLMKKLTVI